MILEFYAHVTCKNALWVGKLKCCILKMYWTKEIMQHCNVLGLCLGTKQTFCSSESILTMFVHSKVISLSSMFLCSCSLFIFSARVCPLSERIQYSTRPLQGMHMELRNVTTYTSSLAQKKSAQGQSNRSVSVDVKYSESFPFSYSHLLMITVLVSDLLSVPSLHFRKLI